ncbi:MAG TPA: hypothetical protein VHR45_03700 [Thermoanaerobaculia bacterium]|nr:hypothetical protein [Thermoanaerobaculia bacterium]
MSPSSWNRLEGAAVYIVTTETPSGGGRDDRDLQEVPEQAEAAADLREAPQQAKAAADATRGAGLTLSVVFSSHRIAGQVEELAMTASLGRSGACRSKTSARPRAATPVARGARRVDPLDRPGRRQRREGTPGPGFAAAAALYLALACWASAGAGSSAAGGGAAPAPPHSPAAPAAGRAAAMPRKSEQTPAGRSEAGEARAASDAGDHRRSVAQDLGEEPQAALSRAELPAVGRQDAILTVSRFGRFSIRIASKQGTALQVVDRMAGALGKSGEPGRENGRLDLFLDRGRYKIAAESSDKGSGAAKLAALPFHEPAGGARPAAGGRPPSAVVPVERELVERKLVEERLDDLEQLSFWLQLAERREVRFEAAGRFLADLRLWRDGSWLEDAPPLCNTIQPVVGHPLLRCEIAAVLPAGLYRLSAYGGPSLPWAEESPERPLYLRWGAPELPDAGRRRYEISPFGEDRFLLPDDVNYARLELPEALPASIAAGWLKPGAHFFRGGSAGAQVTRKTSPLAVEIDIPTASAAKEQEEEAAPAAAPAAAGRGEAEETETAAAAEDEAAAGAGSANAGQGREANEGAAGAGQAATSGMEGEGEGTAEARGQASAGGEEPAESAADQEKTGGEEAGATPGGEQGPARSKGAAGPARLWIAVRGTAGQPYVLEHFEKKDVYSYRKEGPYWISTVHTGNPEDSIDATAVLTALRFTTGERERVVAKAAVPLDSGHAWARRFNLLERLSLFFDVQERGSYEIVAGGDAAGHYRIEPFLTSRPARYKAPPFAPGGSRWELDPGLYVLVAEPAERKGIVVLGVRPAGKFPRLLDDASPPAGSEGTAGPKASPVQASVHLGQIELESDTRYTLHINAQPGVRSGAVLRSWPVDLQRALPLSQRPGESLTLTAELAAPSTLRAQTEDGSLLQISVDGGPFDKSSAVAAGRHEVAVRNEGGGTVVYSLAAEPQALAAAAPLPPLPAAALAALPRFPVLRPGVPRYLDLERGASATFLVQAEQPALYELQTTGLLATSGILRTRTVTRLDEKSANGVGRNALLRQYLREGDYQATVTATGLTRGHLGVELASTPLLDGGDLRPGAPARLSLPAGQGVVYRFTIDKKADYRLRAMGLGFHFLCRLEDAEGWPIELPNLKADLTRRFEPGSYRLVLLPQPVASRALTLLAEKKEPPHFEGHGPHELPLTETVSHLWREPGQAPAAANQSEEEATSARPPDLWRFELPAPARTTVELTAEMEGTIRSLSDGGAVIGGSGGSGAGAGGGGGAADVVGTIPPGRSFTGDLPAGRYEIAALCSRRNSLVRYWVRVTTAQLVAGEERAIKAPATLAVAVGQEALVELASFGGTDVRARLFDAQGKLVADEDDRPDDWNFLVFQRLPAGSYRLEVVPVGARRASVSVAMRTIAEVEGKTLALPFRGQLELGAPGDRGGQVRLYPLQLPRKADLVLAAAQSQESLGLALEMLAPAQGGKTGGGPGWRQLASATGHQPRIGVPLPAANAAHAANGSDTAGNAAPAYRLRLWSLDHQGMPAQLAVTALATPRVSESRIRAGVSAARVAGFEPPTAALAVDLERPGLLGALPALGSAAAPPSHSSSKLAASSSAALSSGSALEVSALPGHPVAALGEGAERIFAAPGRRVWLVQELRRGAARFRLERIAVEPGPDSAAALTSAGEPTAGQHFRLPARRLVASCDLQEVPRQAKAAADLHPDHPGPVLALVTALAGQPAVRLTESNENTESTSTASDGSRGLPPASAMAVGARAALAVALRPRHPVARVWEAGPDGAPSELRVTQLSFPPPATAQAAWGIASASLEGRAARSYELPAGGKKLRLSLGEATVAVLSQGDAVLSTHWQGGRPFEELLETDASRLTVLHTGAGGDPFTFELLPPGQGEEQLALQPGKTFERRFDRAGTLRLRVPAPGSAGPAAVHVLGSAPADASAAFTPASGLASDSASNFDAVLLDDSGSVGHGADLESRAGGALLVRHGPGALLVWEEDGAAPGGAENALFGPSSPLSPPVPVLDIAPPATVALSGQVARFAIVLREPAVVHLRAATPAVTLARPEGGPAGTGLQVHPESIRLDAYLPAGRSRLGLRALFGAPLSGFAELTTTPVTPIGEGLGPEVLLPAGAIRYFSFHVERQGPLGWGVAAGAGGVECQLFDAAGLPAGGAPAAWQGALVQMGELAPGDYLLAVRARQDAAPVRARPALAGLTLPDTGPPEEVVRQYLREAGVAVPASASREGQEP